MAISHQSLEFYDDLLAVAVSVDPHSLKPWESLAEVIQAARHVDLGIGCGVQSQSQSVSLASLGQKHARGKASICSGAPLSSASFN